MKWLIQKPTKDQIIKRILLLWIISIGLVLSNPTKSDFSDYVEHEIEKQSDNENFIVGGLMNLFSKPTTFVIESNTQRVDLWILSVYGTSILGEEAVFIGVCGTFFKVR